jgi:hypothetical protein
LLAAIAASFVGTYPTGIFTAVVCALAIVVASNMFTDHGVGFVVGGVLSCLAAILTLIWMPLAVLSIRGEPMTATVTAKHVIRGRNSAYQYELQAPDGRPVAGVLTEYKDRYAPGALVDVVVDRGSLVDPQQAGQLGDAEGLGIAAAGTLALTIVVSIATGARSPMEKLDLRFSWYRARH